MGCMFMDIAVMRKLNRQGLIFAVLHSFIFLNLAIELLLI